MSSVRYTKAAREALSAKRREETIARRSALTTPEALEELAPLIEDGAIALSSGRVIPVAEFVPAWQRGELLLNV